MGRPADDAELLPAKRVALGRRLVAVPPDREARRDLEIGCVTEKRSRKDAVSRNRGRNHIALPIRESVQQRVEAADLDRCR